MQDNSKTTLILFCGLPGSGKTTLAKKLEKEGRGVRLNTDEWMADLGFDPNNEEMHTKLQNRLWELAKDLLKQGKSVILENGLWMKHERDNKRADAKQLGVNTELHYLKVPLVELIRRLEPRNEASKHGHAYVSKEQITEFYKIFEEPNKDELEMFTNVVVH